MEPLNSSGHLQFERKTVRTLNEANCDASLYAMNENGIERRPLPAQVEQEGSKLPRIIEGMRPKNFDCSFKGSLHNG